MPRSRIVEGSVAAGWMLIEVFHPVLERPESRVPQTQMVTLVERERPDHSHGENHTPVNPCVGPSVQTTAVTSAPPSRSSGSRVVSG
jgi:hypothetical protein